jgi:hypothetical protein
MFYMVYNRDLNEEAFPKTWYLDLATGGMLAVYANDQDAESERGVSAEDNRRRRRWAESNPRRFLEICGGNSRGRETDPDQMSDLETVEYILEVEDFLAQSGIKPRWTL